uniref:Uncharacterized protein n=1 Tax=Arundo donax TaxID=35708 RepID=A0A0A9BTB8_ARUDO
MLPGVRGGF